MRSTEGEAGFGNQPQVPDPPDWFNRARAGARHRQGADRRSVARPVPAGPDEAISWFQNIRVSGLAGRRPTAGGVYPPPLAKKSPPSVHPGALPDFPELPRRRSTGGGWIALAAAVALPAVFAVGFLTHATFPRQETAQAPVGQGSAEEAQATTADVPQERGTAERGMGSAARLAPDALLTSSETSQNTTRRQVELNAAARGETASVPRVEDTNGDDGFVLRAAGAVSFADIRGPQKTWFALASNDAECESGACQIAPVNTADRKLNTALEWTSSPAAAADLARREGKLVFLIHVSGNFAQPGFT